METRIILASVTSVLLFALLVVFELNLDKYHIYDDYGSYIGAQKEWRKELFETERRALLQYDGSVGLKLVDKRVSSKSKPLDLSGRLLRGIDFSGSYITYADFSRCNFIGAKLEGASLGGSDLRGANLKGVNLQGVNLRGVDLSGADFTGANLHWADLTGAKIEKTRFDNAELSRASFRPRRTAFHSWPT